MKSSALKEISEEKDTALKKVKIKKTKKRRKRTKRANKKFLRDENVIDLFSSSAAAGKLKLNAKLKEKIIIEYRVKARKIARAILKSWNAKLDREEIDSLVDLSLCEAIKRYDPQKGASFLTFVYYDIKGHLIKAIQEATEVVAALGNEEFLENMHHQGTITTEDIVESLTGKTSLSPEEALYQKELMEIIIKASEKLSLVEKEVLNKVYAQGRHTTEAAKELGYSRSHLSRIKTIALKTLKGELEAFFGIDKESFPFQEKKTTSKNSKEKESKRQNTKTLKTKRKKRGKKASENSLQEAA